jgi:sirohydrochlorin cobaltochelatase
MPLDSTSGLLLIGHGTRDRKGLAEFAELGRRVASRIGSVPVESAFLELAAPTISIGFDRLVERGSRRIVAAPLLLFAAGHAKHDIPEALTNAARAHPGIAWRQAAPLGCHPALLDLSAQRFDEVMQEVPSERNQCRLILVGRGSHDQEALDEAARYAKLLGERVGVNDVQVSFLAMAQPRLADLLAEAASCEKSTIVVQPHLLFHGELLGEVEQQLESGKGLAPSKRWLKAAHLGPAPELAAVIEERVQEAGAGWPSAL